MAKIKLEELYYGSEKYPSIMAAVSEDILKNGVPQGMNEQTWIEMLYVKHTLKIAEQLNTNGDYVEDDSSDVVTVSL